jgi:uncharacterized protein (UPF0332 family)
MQPSEFQDTAERLAQGTTEGDWRSAISRAYYAVFHYFREFFLLHGLDLGAGAQAHINLYFGLNNCGQPTVPPIAYAVNELRRARTLADYDLNRMIGQTTSSAVVQAAKKVVEDFANLLGTVSAADIVDGARSHLQSLGRLPKP